MKKFFSCCILILLCSALFCGLTAHALPQSAQGVSAPAGVSARYVVLMNMDSQEVLYSKGAETKMYPASTTKIMTAILVLEKCANLDEIVTVGNELDSLPSGSSALWIEKGDRISVRNLLYGLMIKSGNDCALTLGAHISGSVSAFVDEMNAKAAQLGMTNTHFTNPHGFHHKDHYTTATDMTKLSQYALKNEKLVSIMKTSKISIPCVDKNGKSKSFSVTNTNKLMVSNSGYYYEYCTGGKTGFTDEAGQCLISTATKDGQNLLCAVFYDGLGANEKYTTSKNLFEYGFSNFATVNITQLISDMNVTVKTVNHIASDSGTLTPQLDLSQPIYYTSTKAVIDRITSVDSEYISIICPDNVAAPITVGTNLGAFVFKYNDEVLYSSDVIAERNVDKAIVTPGDLTPIPGTNISKDFVGEYLEEAGFYTILIIAGVLLVILILILVYLHMRRRVSLTRNVYRRSRRNY